MSEKNYPKKLEDARFKKGDRVICKCLPCGNVGPMEWFVGTIESEPRFEDCERKGPHVYYGVNFDEAGGTRAIDHPDRLQHLDAISRLGELVR